MEFNKFTQKARSVITNAQTEATVRSNQYISPLHLLKSLIDDEDKVIDEIINIAGGQIDIIRSHLVNELDKIPQVKVHGSSGGQQVTISSDTLRILQNAHDLAKKAGDNFIPVERIFEALFNHEITKSILEKARLTAKNVSNAIATLRGGRTADSDNSENTYNALKKYGRNLTQLAQARKLDPIIGRDEEIRRSIQVLSRRIKNNPILIGDPGVGKTAIIEGLAQRIVDNDVADALSDAQIIELDMGALISGAKFRGEFEERLRAVLNEIKNSSGKIILFIDEIHLLVGTGRTDGAMDASNLLKPMLARGELHCIGATTLDEYRNYIEKDAALARRFQPVYITEPSVTDTVSILRGIKEKYELHHGIRISDSAIIAAATLSNRYITERYLPDKAIDLLDEAASRLKIEISSKPEQLDELDRKIIQLKIDAEALKKEKDESSEQKLQQTLETLHNLEAQSHDLTTKWNTEKLQVQSIQKLKEELEKAKNELEVSQKLANLSRAGELKYSIIPSLTQQLNKLEHINDAKYSGRLIKEVVTAEDIALIVSRATGIPVDKMLSSEKDKLLTMESTLKQDIIGQDSAIEAVSNAIRRARAGIQDENKPLGSFLFLGPTGVGKTELSKSLAKFLFDNPQAILRIDMSEYMEKHSVSRLIGSPPGYVGYEQGGVLTESVRRRPYQVILFDEVEKAHPDIFNLLLQVLDEGRLTDNHGKTVDFKNTIIILTSNLGAEVIAASNNENDEHVNDRVMDIVKSTFKPEFLNRLDEIIIFHRLLLSHMTHIVQLELKKLEKVLMEQKIKLVATNQAIEWLASKGFDQIYGARPLKRIIQRSVQNQLAKLILAGQLGADTTINLIVNDANNLSLQKIHNDSV